MIGFILTFSIINYPLSIVFAAQSLTIPQGTKVWGPFNVQVANKYNEFSFLRQLWTNAGDKLTATVEGSSDKGNTWQLLCQTKDQGGGSETTSRYVCPFPPGTTNVRVTTVATAPIAVPSLPTGGPK